MVAVLQKSLQLSVTNVTTVTPLREPHRGWFDAGKLTLGEYLTRWLEDSVKGNVRHRTLDNCRMQVRCHIIPALGRIGLKALTPPHVRALYRAELDTGLAPSTVCYTHAVLKRALKQAVRWDLVPRNICEAVDLPKRKILARTS